MTSQKKRAALYERISKVPTNSLSAELHEGSTSYSVEDQDVRCRALCDAEDYEVVATFYDDGISAYRSLKTRAGWGDLQTWVQKHDFDVLVFDRQDRLARDQIETMEFIIKCARAGIGWHSAQEGTTDLADTMGVMFAIFRGGEAQAYSDKISKNQRAANSRKREKGLPGAGGRPFGFKIDRITHDPIEAELIRQGTQMVLAGCRRFEVLKLFKDSGVKTVRNNEWHIANVVALLRRWRNAGYVEHDDRAFGKAVWEPIVAIEDVKRLRAILSLGKLPGTWKTPTHLATGIALCHCGSQLVASTNLGDGVYRCIRYVTDGKGMAAGHTTVREAILDPMIDEAVIKSYLVAPDLLQTADAEQRQLAELHEELEDVQARAGTLLDALLEQDITKETYKEKNTPLKTKEQEILDAIMALTASSAHAQMLVRSRSSLAALQKYGVEIGKDYVGLAEHDAVVADLRRAYDDLTLLNKRLLIAANLTITVYPGRGPRRVEIISKATGEHLTKPRPMILIVEDVDDDDAVVARRPA